MANAVHHEEYLLGQKLTTGNSREGVRIRFKKKIKWASMQRAIKTK